MPQHRRRDLDATQLVALARFDMGFVFRSPAFFVMLFIGVVNADVLGCGTVGEFYGSDSYPATRLMVQALGGAFAIMPIFIAIYYAGELVWRDRDRRMHEIVDATVGAPTGPTSSRRSWPSRSCSPRARWWRSLTGMAVQLVKGYTHLPARARTCCGSSLPTVITALPARRAVRVRAGAGAAEVHRLGR